jgi:hypothetical protein
MKWVLLIVPAISVAVLTGCPVGSGITVSGTLTAAPGSVVITNPVTVKVSSSSGTYSTQVDLTGSGTLSATYSLSDVPADSYTVTIVYVLGQSQLYGAYYTVNGGGQVSFGDPTTPDSSAPYTVTIVGGPETISASETIDAYIGNAG